VQKRLNNRFAVWVMDSGEPKKAQVQRAHWRHLANTIELFVCGGDAPYVKLLWPLVIM